jgi:hypothetical protein
MERRWRELLLLHAECKHGIQKGWSRCDRSRSEMARLVSSGGGRPPLWRYFEMDCVLTGLRESDTGLDNAILRLAPFPVGNAGQKGTPHEFLLADRIELPWEQQQQSTDAPPKLATLSGTPDRWMVKLKSNDPVDAMEYRSFIEHVLSKHQSYRKDKRSAEGEGTFATALLPPVVWMFWAQGEHDVSFSPRDRLCVEGWRKLNEVPECSCEGGGSVCEEGQQDCAHETTRGWKVRVLDDSSVSEWAAPVKSLWDQGMPDGARLQHRADLLRTYLLATYGGVWADTSVLPLAPLDAWIPRLEAIHSKRVKQRNPHNESSERDFFFAYTFPDPTLSSEVSMIPHIFDPGN